MSTLMATNRIVQRKFPIPQLHDGVEISMPASGQSTRLEARLASSSTEIEAAQALRYRVFYEELSAIASSMTRLTRKDSDEFDQICDHLLITDLSEVNFSEIVGTYRLLRQEVAEKFNGFYSAREFDLDGILTNHQKLNFLELGRSCVSRTHRNRRTVELLWQGILSYVLHHNVDVMIGCASLEGTDIDHLAEQLSYLHHQFRPPKAWRARAVAGRGVAMNLIADQDVNTKSVLHSLPPLIKGYLRAGAWVGEEAVIDHQFGTTDVLIILPVANINPRYFNHFSRHHLQAA